MNTMKRMLQKIKVYTPWLGFALNKKREVNKIQVNLLKA